MKFIVLDQSTNITGYAVFNDETLIDHGIIKTKSKKDVVERIIQFIDILEDFINKIKPDMIILEDVQLQSDKETALLKSETNILTFKTLSKLLGNIEVMLTKKEIKYHIYPPSTWRRLLSFRGNKREELKIEAVKFVRKKYNIEIEIDAAEAICIGLAHLETQNRQSKLAWGSLPQL